MKKILILFVLFTALNIFSLSEDNLSADFKNIIDVAPENQKLIDADFTGINISDYFYFYSLVSEELSQFDLEKKWFDEINSGLSAYLKKTFKNDNFDSLDAGRKKEFAENILFFLHDNVFKHYSLNADRLSNVINGYYNCVSSSIIYSIFLTRYGIKHNAVQTKDHVFIKIDFDNNDLIDVETTNRYGFDPGKKKEVLDEFGKNTGFTYVPQNNYSNRNDVSLKYLVLDIYHNLLNYYFVKNEYLKSCKIAYIIYLIKNDKSGKDDFDAAFNNLIADYSSKNNYTTAIENINSYLHFIGADNRFINIKFDLINNYINNWNDINTYQTFNDYLLDENNKFVELKNDSRFIKSYLLFIYKITKLSNGLNYKNAINILNIYLSNNLGNTDIRNFRFNILNNFVYEWNDYDNFDDMNKYLLSQNNLFDGLVNDKKFIEIYLNFINKQVIFYDKQNFFGDSYKLIKYFNSLFNNDNIKKIFSNIIIDEFEYYKKTDNYSVYSKRFNELIGAFPEYNDIINKFKIIYITEKVYYLAKSDNYKDAINEYKILYNENQNTLDVKNTLINLYVDYTIKLYYKNDITGLITYCDEGILLFPENSTLKNNYLSFLLNIINNYLNNNDKKSAENILKIAIKKFPNNNKLQLFSKELE